MVTKEVLWDTREAPPHAPTTREQRHAQWEAGGEKWGKWVGQVLFSAVGATATVSMGTVAVGAVGAGMATAGALFGEGFGGLVGWFISNLLWIGLRKD